MKETIRHEGVVEQVKSTTCLVRIMQQTACGGCAVKHLCKSSESKEKVVEACMDGVPVHVGQMVMVEGSLRQGLRAVWIAYAIPLLLMVGVLFLGCTLWGEDVGALLALLLLGLYYAGLYLFRGHLDRRFRFVVTPLDSDVQASESGA